MPEDRLVEEGRGAPDMVGELCIRRPIQIFREQRRAFGGQFRLDGVVPELQVLPPELAVEHLRRPSYPSPDLGMQVGHQLENQLRRWAFRAFRGPDRSR